MAFLEKRSKRSLITHLKKLFVFSGSSRSTCLVADQPLVAIAFRPRFASDTETVFTIKHMSNGVLWRSAASPVAVDFNGRFYRKEGYVMLVSIGAILNVRKILGWGERVMELPEGSTLGDWLKAIKLPEKGNVYELMIGKEGHLDAHYRMYLDEKRIGDGMLDVPIKDHDRLVLMDAVTLPSLSFLND